MPTLAFSSVRAACGGFANPVFLSWLAFLPGCAWVTQNHAATAEYSRQVSNVAMRAATVEEQLSEAEARVAALEETVRMHGQNEATRLETLDEVNAEISRLRGQIEELRFAVDELKRATESRDLSTERRHLHAEKRLKQIEDFLKIKAPPPPTDAELGVAGAAGAAGSTGTSGGTAEGTTGTSGTETAATGTTTTPPPEVAAPTTAAASLVLAKEHIAAGRTAVARALLEKAVDDHPGSAELPEIRFLIGETYFAEKNWRRAAMAYESVHKNHNKSEFAPEAMFRQAEIFEINGKPDQARLFWEGVISNWPKSDAARRAREELGK